MATKCILSFRIKTWGWSTLAKVKRCCVNCWYTFYLGKRSLSRHSLQLLSDVNWKIAAQNFFIRLKLFIRLWKELRYHYITDRVKWYEIYDHGPQYHKLPHFWISWYSYDSIEIPIENHISYTGISFISYQTQF